MKNIVYSGKGAVSLTVGNGLVRVTPGDNTKLMHNMIKSPSGPTRQTLSLVLSLLM